MQIDQSIGALFGSFAGFASFDHRTEKRNFDVIICLDIVYYFSFNRFV